MPALHLTHLTLDLVHLLLHGLSLPSHDCGGTRTHGRLRIPEPAKGDWGTVQEPHTTFRATHTYLFSLSFSLLGGPIFLVPHILQHTTKPTESSQGSPCSAPLGMHAYLQNISGCPRSSSSSYRNSIPSSTVTERGQSNLVTLYHL